MPEPFVQLDAVAVHYHGRRVGAIAIDPTSQLPVFEYFPEWLDDPEDLAPFTLPAAPGPRVFPELRGTSFRGAPGLVADSLPGQFADLLTNAWLARHGVQPGQITVVDRLGYIGSRGVGALTFHPSLEPGLTGAPSVVDLSEASDTARAAVSGTLDPATAGSTLEHLLDTSGSAGGARAKASIARGPGGEVRSGQHDAPEGFTHWLLKFDVAPRSAPGQTTGLGQLEYAYHLMAVDAGLHMTECDLLEVDGLVHFLTQRFDRNGPTGRVHVQSLAALAHLPPENPGVHGYEQFLQACMRLQLDHDTRRQAFRQIVFNLAAAVRDDHTKNFAFLYDNGRWRLAPAFDLTFPFLDGGGWLTHHQMTVAGSMHDVSRDVLFELAERAKVSHATDIVAEVMAAVSRWPDHAATAGVLEEHRNVVAAELSRTSLAT